LQVMGDAFVIVIYGFDHTKHWLMLMMCCIVFGWCALWSYEGSCTSGGAPNGMQQKIKLSFFLMVVVWKLIVHLASRSGKYSTIRLQLCVGWDKCPFATNCLYLWSHAFSVNLGLQADV
jgi:hypothetical protein